jgi:hypothetical protein
MSDRIIKLLGTEAALSTATTLGAAQLVRVYNDTAGAVLITVADSGTTTGTATVKAGEIIFIRKKAAETIAAGSAVKAVSIAFGD